MPICSYRNLQKRNLKNSERSLLGKAEGHVEEVTFRWASEIFLPLVEVQRGEAEKTPDRASTGGKAQDGETH